MRDENRVQPQANEDSPGVTWSPFFDPTSPLRKIPGKRTCPGFVVSATPVWPAENIDRLCVSRLVSRGRGRDSPAQDRGADACGDRSVGLLLLLIGLGLVPRSPSVSEKLPLG